jgi:ESS family glutamate:Na+ symporter
MENQFTLIGTNLVIASILVLAAGKYLNSKISILNHFNIPVAVTGGLLCSMLLLIFYKGFGLRVDVDMELRNLLLLSFFSTIGLSAKLKTLVSGGKTLLILIAFAVLLLIFQDAAGVAIALLFDAPPAYCLFAGSISFAGAHGTAIAWGETAEKVGLSGAGTLGIACATFGLVAGGVIGSPVAGMLINKYKLRELGDDDWLRGCEGRGKGRGKLAAGGSFCDIAVVSHLCWSWS